MTLLSSVAYLGMNFSEIRAKARDDKRLGDMVTFERAVNEYFQANGSYPDTDDTTRTSITLPLGNLGPVGLVTDGWIDSDMSAYIPKLPTDPINDATYYYSYRHTTNSYEFNAVLEVLTEYSTGDGGDDDALYEVGNNLTVL